MSLLGDCRRSGRERGREHSATWMVLLNVVMLVIQAAVALGTIIACVYWLVRPGERNPQHPKYLILNADR